MTIKKQKNNEGFTQPHFKKSEAFKVGLPSPTFSQKSGAGFTLIETLVYIAIMTMMFVIIFSLVMTIFNTRKQLRASHRVNDNARFVVNFLTNRIHNVSSITDVNPASEQLHFYESATERFSLDLEGDDLVYRYTEDVGSGFPAQSTADPVLLNNNYIDVSAFDLTPISDAYANPNQGALITFTISTGNAGDPYGYLQKTFTTFISIR